jgi:hypothetical protein
MKTIKPFVQSTRAGKNLKVTFCYIKWEIQGINQWRQPAKGQNKV